MRHRVCATLMFEENAIGPLTRSNTFKFWSLPTDINTSLCMLFWDCSGFPSLVSGFEYAERFFCFNTVVSGRRNVDSYVEAPILLLSAVADAFDVQAEVAIHV